jgi:hypothetical protein
MVWKSANIKPMACEDPDIFHTDDKKLSSGWMYYPVVKDNLDSFFY